MSETKRKWGDRKDGTWINKTDSMHLFMPFLYPKRTDAEAVVQEEVDVAPLLDFVAAKNAQNPEDRYTVFNAFTTAIMKTITLRPQLNRFYKGGRLYQRNYLALAFVAKKKFTEGSEESLLFFKARETDTVTDLHDRIYKVLNRIRKKDENDKTTDIIGVLCRFPRPIVYFLMRIFRILDFYGKMPNALISDDPHFASVWITNLGSIKLNANYHHLNNWGTNSMFVVVGEMHDKVVPDGNGGVTVKKVLPFAITLDERITDGFYCSRSVKLLKYLLAHPEYLDRPAGEEVDFD